MVPFICVVGMPKSGKTSFIEALVKEFKKRKYKVGAVKHTSHTFEIDMPGKDSYRLKESGSIIGGVFSDDRIGIIKDIDHKKEDLSRMLEDCFYEMDIVLIEGYKVGKYPKVLVTGGREIAKELSEFKKEEIIAVIGDIDDKGINPDFNYFGRYEIKKAADFLEKEFIRPYSIQEIDLYINNKPVVLNDFVQKVMINILNGMISSLKDIDEVITDVDLRYKKNPGPESSQENNG